MVKRKAIEYNLHPYEIDNKGRTITIYSDQDIGISKVRILEDYDQFIKLLVELGNLFPLPLDFLKVMFVKAVTDARYSSHDCKVIFVNLAAYQVHRDKIYWLFTICRELAYIRDHQLGYPFFKDMRRLMVHALNRQLQT
jgi:hypothetical protein